MNRIALQRCGVALACAASFGAFAQSKTDGQWRGTGGAALSLSSGNTTASSLQLNADGSRATASDKISLGAVINYAKNRTNDVDQTTSDKWAGFGQYDYNLSSSLYGFGRLDLSGDKLIDLSLRTALAGGVGYKVVNTESTSFDLLGGAGYTTDRYASSQTIGDTTDTTFSRASLYLGETSSHKLSPTTLFKQRLDFYPGLSGDKAVLARFNAGLSVAMSATLSLTVGLTDDYNSKPPAGRKSNDAGLFTGINVKFGAL